MSEKPVPQYEGQILIWDIAYKATNKVPKINKIAFYKYRETYKAVKSGNLLTWQLQYDFQTKDKE